MGIIWYSSYSHIGMSRTPKAIDQLPPATLAAIEKLGADLAVARLRRKESLASWAKRMGVSISTLQRLESGDPTISVGIVASALWLMSRDSAIAELAAPANDLGAMELEVREAEELGRARARASQEARIKAAANKTRKSDNAMR
jgi:transcriptional regulator with XRE-family HTH domain